jgi:hypothetical protein
MRKKLFVIGILLQAIFVLAVTNESRADCRVGGTNSGRCPKGSCAAGGGEWACNLKNCSPQNCRR